MPDPDGGTVYNLGVIDEADCELDEAVRARGINVLVTTTIMADPANARRLARAVLS